jgi:hypothetical protein
VVDDGEKGDAVNPNMNPNVNSNVNLTVTMNMTMNNIFMAIAIGIGIGVAVVMAIAVLRANQKVNSLVDEQEYVNAIVTVRVPFNQNTLGSVWIERSGQRIMMTAQTRENQEFLRGDQAVVVEVDGGKVWVTPASSSWS